MGAERGPPVRARIVACEVKWSASDASEFAATPPLEALRDMASIAASDSQLHLDFLGARKAHLSEVCRCRAVIKLPVEVGGGYALLNRDLYGTRDAASAWNACIQRVLVNELGFERGRKSPCLFWHNARKIRVIVHGDDFVSLATTGELAWLRANLRKKVVDERTWRAWKRRRCYHHLRPFTAKDTRGLRTRG